jgi:hypothetical protein
MRLTLSPLCGGLLVYKSYSVCRDQSLYGSDSIWVASAGTKLERQGDYRLKRNSLALRGADG